MDSASNFEFEIDVVLSMKKTDSTGVEYAVSEVSTL